jgi:hypothetical protein
VVVIDSSTPAFPPRTLALQVVQPGQHGGQRLFGYKGSYNDDLVQTWFGIGPQIDGLGHLGQDGVYYNCNNEKDFVAITGLKKLGTDKIPPIVARGVLIDMAKHFKVAHLDAGKVFTAADVQAAARAQGVTNRPFFGHVILLKEHGIYILETMNTGQLAREGVHEFLFVLGQARIRGTVQMLINPVAIY